MQGVRRCSLPKNLSDRENFQYYREAAKGYSKRFKHRDEYQRFVRLFFKEVAKQLVDSVGGVYLKGIGYFGVLMLPEKTQLKYRFGGISNFNPHTDNYTYRLTFYPEQRANTMLPLFGMEREFIMGVKKRLVRNLKSGVRYKTHIYSIQNFWRVWKPLSINDLEKIKDINLDEYTRID
jgi:hypothetical protein